MQASTPTIRKVFVRDRLLEIPYFQRHYVWTEENWERFANDMESVLDNNTSYFLGAIILKNIEPSDTEKENGINSKYKLIDGQQRLTTLSIYIKLLHLFTGKNTDFIYQFIQDDNATPILLHNCDDRAAFNHILLLDTAQSDFPGMDGNIKEAYKYFYGRFRKLLANGVCLDKLTKALFAHILFVEILLDNNDDEQKIFDTINSLGVELTDDELLKNFLYQSDADESDYKKNWRPMFDTNEARAFWDVDAAKTKQTKTRDSRVINRFLFAFVKIKMWDFALSKQDKNSFVKSTEIYNTCRAFVEKYKCTRNELANEIISYAKLYKDNFTNDILDERIPKYGCLKRIVCFMTANNEYGPLPYVLYILKNVSDKEERNKIFSFLECYLVRRMLSHSSNKDYIGLFSEYMINSKINSYEKLYKYIMDKPLTANLHMPNLSEIQKQMDNCRCDDSFACTIWYLYETKQLSKDKSTIDGGYNEYFVEQLMPLPGKIDNPSWPKHQDEDEEANRVATIKTLSNFFLLQGGEVNIKQMRKKHLDSFEEKKTLMKSLGANIPSTKQKLEKLKTWKEADITKRNHDYAKNFCEITWSVNNG